MALRCFLALLLTVALQAHGAERPLAQFIVPSQHADLEPLLARVAESVRNFESIDREDDERQLRRLRANALDVLATEGYFSAQVEVVPSEAGNAQFELRVAPGPRATVARIDLVLKGAIEKDPDRIKSLQSEWALPVGQPFRDAAWSAAKNKLLARVQEKDFAAARLVDSLAEVDEEKAEVALRIDIDSGPAFTVGVLSIKGLSKYEPALIERFNPFKPGDRYDATRLLDFQRQLQSGPYFASVIVDVDVDRGDAERVPIRVEVSEAKPKRVSFGLGYSTDTGPRAEITYRQALLFGYPYTLQTGAGIDRVRSVAYADVYLPPKPNGAIDSLGTLVEHTDIENVITNRWAVGAARALTRESGPKSTTTRLSFNYQSEVRRLRGSRLPDVDNNVLSTTYTWTRREVDQVTDPTRGDVLSLSGSVGLQRNALGRVLEDTFVRAYARYVRYFALSPRDRIILRGELGHVVADELESVPNEFLFRAGGAGSVRGYAYQSLGLKTGTATIGSRSLAVGSAEYVRWFTDSWGGALFYDLGDADDKLLKVRWARGYGVGARWRTLAGPLALDVAYGEREQKLRVHFSIAVAF